MVEAEVAGALGGGDDTAPVAGLAEGGAALGQSELNDPRLKARASIAD